MNIIKFYKEQIDNNKRQMVYNIIKKMRIKNIKDSTGSIVNVTNMNGKIDISFIFSADDIVEKFELDKIHDLSLDFYGSMIIIKRARVLKMYICKNGLFHIVMYGEYEFKHGVCQFESFLKAIPDVSRMQINNPRMVPSKLF